MHLQEYTIICDQLANNFKDRDAISFNASKQRSISIRSADAKPKTKTFPPGNVRAWRINKRWNYAIAVIINCDNVKGSALFSPFPWSYRLYFLSAA